MILIQQHVTQNVLHLIVFWCLGVPLLWCGVLLSAVNRSTSLCWEVLPVQEHSLKGTHWLFWLPCWISHTFIHLLPLCPLLPCLYLWIYPSLEFWISFSSGHLLSCLFLFTFSLSAFGALIFPSKTFEVNPASNAFTNQLATEGHKNKRNLEKPCNVCESRWNSINFFSAIFVLINYNSIKIKNSILKYRKCSPQWLIYL